MARKRLSLNWFRQFPRPISIPQCKRFQSASTMPPPEVLYETLTSRKLPIIYETVTPETAHKLNMTLQSYVPPSWLTPSHTADDLLDTALPPAFHLVYFNPALPASVLLPDGTDPNQSPGLPFVRRMWAGGYIKWNSSSDRKGQVLLQGDKYACVEGIRDVVVKGKPGSEKVFVGIERRVGQVEKGWGELEVREKLWGKSEDDLGRSRFVERRNIVFMRERTEEELRAIKEKGVVPKAGKILKPQHPPTFTHSLIPDATLLFRYSALTFNAHAIHLDPSYCRNVEGHRNLLVHGPLSFTLLSLLLQSQIKDTSTPLIESIEYRNLAPLYSEEPLKLCGRAKGEGAYELWAETPEGGIAVKASAKVTGNATA